MKERPIIFSAPMVRALLAGTKTQTRRVVKQRDLAWMDEHQGLREPSNALRCPYGQPGGRLWVRETFAFTDAHEPEYMGSVDYLADGACIAVDHGPVLSHGVEHGCDKRPYQGPWKPSIHMPRWASRILLEIVSVRVERLQDISEADARTEGIVELPGQAAEPGCWWTGNVSSGAALHGRTPSAAYRLLWESINGPGSWDANPWVWAVEFKVVKGAA